MNARANKASIKLATNGAVKKRNTRVDETRIGSPMTAKSQPSARTSNLSRFAETGQDLEEALSDAIAASGTGATSAAERRRRKNLGGRPPLEEGSETLVWKVKAPSSLDSVARKMGREYEGGFSAFVRDAVREKVAAQGATGTTSAHPEGVESSVTSGVRALGGKLFHVVYERPEDLNFDVSSAADSRRGDFGLHA